MKRTKKLLVLAMILGCLASIRIILTKIMQHAGEPFPGARVVLDDASWRSLWKGEELDGIYKWAAPDTMLYWRWEKDKQQVTLRRFLSDGTATPPQKLPIVLAENDWVESLSPDAKILCIEERFRGAGSQYRLVRADGQGKPVRFRTKASDLFWSPDCRFLYGLYPFTSSPYLERVDARTGAIVKTPAADRNKIYLDTVTPEGKLLIFSSSTNESINPPMKKWRIGELRDGRVHSTSYQKRFPSISTMLHLSPDGKRLLWSISNEENTFWERLQNKLLRKKIPPKWVTRFEVTDADGTHARTIGSIPEEIQETVTYSPHWLPDSRSVCFVIDKKLWRLEVP